MHFFNYTFTPFGIIIVIFAITLSSPERKDTVISLITLFIQFLTNFYIFKNIYHFKNINNTRTLLVIFNIITTSVVFYFISAYWAPSWLLYTMPSVFASTFLDRRKTILIAILSALAMYFIYWLRSLLFQAELSLTASFMALCHGLFIIILSIFINNISQTLTRIKTNR